MPSTPEVTSSSNVSALGVASDECRLNALKNRKENDWYGHDTGNTTTSVSRPASSSSGLRTINKTSQESEQWFRFDANTASSPSEKPEAVCRGKGRVYGEQQDWYKHGPEVPDPPSLEKRSKTRSRRGACAEVRQKGSDPNDWFRHEHAQEQEQKGGATSEENKPAKRPVKIASPTALWAIYPEDGKNSAEILASTPRSKSRLTAPEADDYYRRDKIGSSAVWFSHHEHQQEDPSGSGGVTPVARVRGTPEGGEIATRLKGESEDWFHHDLNRNYVAPLPVNKGNSPFAKELKERAQGREIKQLFLMEENLKSTWKSPPPLVGTKDSSLQGHNVETPGNAPNGSTPVQQVEEMMDGLLRNSKNSPTNP